MKCRVCKKKYDPKEIASPWEDCKACMSCVFRFIDDGGGKSSIELFDDWIDADADGFGQEFLESALEETED